jgi:hypothetical protein
MLCIRLKNLGRVGFVFIRETENIVNDDSQIAGFYASWQVAGI